jgi:hypothetical protein
MNRILLKSDAVQVAFAMMVKLYKTLKRGYKIMHIPLQVMVQYIVRISRGFLPTILEKWFDERVQYKDKRDEYEVGSEEL